TTAAAAATAATAAATAATAATALRCNRQVLPQDICRLHQPQPSSRLGRRTLGLHYFSGHATCKNRKPVQASQASSLA
ncbi:MAG: hypothetical protein ACRECU_11655, partial [Methylocella sp.]